MSKRETLRCPRCGVVAGGCSCLLETAKVEAEGTSQPSLRSIDPIIALAPSPRRVYVNTEVDVAEREGELEMARRQAERKARDMGMELVGDPVVKQYALVSWEMKETGHGTVDTLAAPGADTGDSTGTDWPVQQDEG